MARLLLSSILGLLIVGLLGSCDTTPTRDAQTTPTPNVSASKTPRPTPNPPRSVPSIPEPATEKTAKGAQAFAAHYFQVYYYSKYSDDWKPLQRLSMPGCGSCKLLWDGSLGGHVEYAGDPKVIGESLESLKFLGDKAFVDTDRDMPWRSWRPASDGLIKEFEPWEFHDEFELVYRDGGWRVRTIMFQNSSETSPPPKYAW